VVAIPNIAHLSVRLALLGGKFPYSASGLLDRTQLRFFTSESAYKLLGDAGFVVGHFQRVQHIPTDPAQFEVPYDLESVSPAVVEFILRDPDAWTRQFILVGHPLGQAGLEFIQSRMKQLADEAESARIDVANLTQQLSTVRELQIEIESLTERAVAA